MSKFWFHHCQRLIYTGNSKPLLEMTKQSIKRLVLFLNTFFKEAVLKMFGKFTENTSTSVSFLIKNGVLKRYTGADVFL